MRRAIRRAVRFALPLALAACAAGCPGDVAPPMGPGAPASAESSPSDAGYTLGDPAYRFCNEPGADADEALGWCPMLEGSPGSRCPGLRATCEQGARENVLTSEGCVPSVGGAPSGTPAPPPKKPRKPLSCDWDPEWSCEMPKTSMGFATAVAKWAGALLVALLVLLVLRIAIRLIGTRRPSATTIAEEQPARVLPEEAPPIPEAPSGDLLEAARAALARGDFADAVLMARGAALRKLAEAGRIGLHRSRTDREYLRSVRRDEGVRAPLGEVLGAVESQRWGGVPPGPSVADRVVRAAERILALVAAVCLVGVLAGAGSDAWRFGPEGDAALFDLFARQGFDVSWRLRGLASLGDETDAIVVDLSGIDPGDREWQALRRWVKDGGVLIAGGAAEEGFPELGSLEVLPPGSVARRGAGVSELLPVPIWPGGPAYGWSSTAGRRWIVAGADDDPRAVVEAMPLGEGAVIGIADERLLRNGALVAPVNEQLLAYLLYHLADHASGEGWWTMPAPLRIQLATLSSAGSTSPVGALANARLLPVVVQLILFVALAALWKGWPFGPLKDPPGEGRLRFSDHVTALGTRYLRLGASRHALAAYAGLWLARLGPHGLEAAAVKAGWAPGAARELVERLQRVASEPEGHDRPNDLVLMEDLWNITKRP